MALEAGGSEQEDNNKDGLNTRAGNGKMDNGQETQGSEGEEEGEEEEEDEEPRLKYASLTKHLKPVYRNGDMTSAFLVGGDKMVIGTHNGNIHVLSLPSYTSIRVYHAHSTSVSAVSISPFPPPLPAPRSNANNRLASAQKSSPAPSVAGTSKSSTPGRSPQPPPVPNTASNQIYIATSSLDGNVCVASLTDPKDVMLRNFGRPVQGVALSPDYKNDHSYLSGGLAGNLILTVGGRSGTSSKSNAGAGAAATASGWLGAIGLGSNTGQDTILHSGEGAIRTIQWSLSGKYVVWVNEKGIKLMRSNLHLETHESESAWKRINHIDYPDRAVWEEMAAVWKPRAKWIDETGLETDDLDTGHVNGPQPKSHSQTSHDSGTPLAKSTARRKRSEKLVVGWGDTIWITNVLPGDASSGKRAGKIARVEILKILRTDCIVSGVSLYTPSLLVVLAYVPPGESQSSPQYTPTSGRHRRQNALQPEIRLIDVETKEEVSVADTLNVSRYESLSATDYHLDVLPAMVISQRTASSKGALEIIGGGIWDVGMYPARLFSSSASVRSNDSHSAESSSRAPSDLHVTSPVPGSDQLVHPSALTHGMKIFIQSPYDCVLATKPTLTDHFNWLDTHAMYEQAWNLLDQHPEVAGDNFEASTESTPSTPTRAPAKGQGTLLDFFLDDKSQTTASGPSQRNLDSHVEREKRRIGELWIQQLTKHNDWSKAGATCGKVLTTGDHWEHWVWVFAQADKFEDITPYVPSTQLQPPLPSIVYELVLGYYVSNDRKRLKSLLERWPTELFDAGPVIEAIQGRLQVGDIGENSTEDGHVGRDWRILMECLAKLYLADGRPAQALRCYIRLQDADTAMRLIGEYHLVDAVSDDISDFILLRVSKEQQRSAPLTELENASREPIRLLVAEAHHGIVRPESVIKQLNTRYGSPNPYLFFYFRALWEGDTAIEGQTKAQATSKDRKQSLIDERLVATEGKALVSDHADAALPLFAEYDRRLLMNFLKTSQTYTLDFASKICKQRKYIPELVYLLSKEGRMTEALRLIIDEIGDVSQAIAFAKEQGDQSLWDDLLNYSMNKPSFIRGLLEEVGTSIDPVKLVRKIPEGLEIQGLKGGLKRIIREYEIQHSISEGVARVLRGEVAAAMADKGKGLNKGIKFEIGETHKDPITMHNSRTGRPRQVKKGYCPGCERAFIPEDPELLISFPCQHVFHLPCLLSMDGKGTEDIPASLRNLDWQSEFDRSIGPKVDHAALLRDQVDQGCPLENRDGG
ncbi:MAG: hypothetical protein LQ339_000620 [Xanthoria mediterranea]|nr:MAG: hypothetical protein LQ339_000620 [Xanthoria mediterranea]